MAEHARQGLRGFVWWNGGPLDASMKRRAVPAAVAALALFALLEALLYSGALSLLPAYPAVVAAVLVWTVLPGWLAQRAFFTSRTATLVEQVAFSFLMSMALAAPAGLLSLRLHWSLDTFATLYALTAAAASAVALIWPREQSDVEEVPEEPAAGLPSVLLAAALAIPVLAILTSPAWAGDISRDADDLVYSAYVNQYVTNNELDASGLFNGTREGAFGRMSVNVWVATDALLADQADVQALDLLQTYLPPLMTVLAVAATFAFARGIFRSTTAGLLAGVIMLAYAALDLSPHEGFGRNVILRIAEDKMLASFVLLPLALLVANGFLSGSSWRNYLALQATVIALAVVHPMSVLFFGVAFASITVFRALVDRSPSPLRSAALFGLPWAIPGLIFLVASGFGDEPDVGVELLFRREFHLNDLGGGFVAGNYHMLVHPLVLLALVAAPVLWLLNRTDRGAQVTVAIVAGVLAVFFVPPIATPMAELVSEQGAWRLPWVLPVPAILAYACVQVASRLTPARAQPLAALGVAGVVLAGALVVQELYESADGGVFYNRTSSTSILPGTDHSVVLGGIDRARSGDWRPAPGIEEVIEYLRDNVPPGSIVLAPSSIGRFFPGALENVRAVDEHGAPDPLERAALVNGFYEHDLRGEELTSRLERFGVTHIVVGAATSGEEAVQSMNAAAVEPFDPTLAFAVASFIVRQGEPDLALQDGMLAWSFDADALEELRGREFVAPRQRLTALLETAPAAAANLDTFARLIVTIERVEDGQVVAGTQLHTVFDTSLPANTSAGQRLVRLRTLPPMTPGVTYHVRVWRDGPSALDTYADDILFTGLKFVGATDEQPIEYHVYRYGANEGTRVASVDFLDYEMIAGLTPDAGDALLQLRDAVPAGSTVLAPPSIGSLFYDMLAGVRPVDDVYAPDVVERRGFLEAFFDNTLTPAQVEAGLQRYGVTHAVLGPRLALDSLFVALPGTAPPEELAVLTPDSFQLLRGDPEITSSDDGGPYQAWAFDPAQREMVSGPTFTVPSSDSSSLDLFITFAPSVNVTERNGGTVRLVVTLDKLEEGKPVGNPVNTVFDEALDSGGASRFVRVRSVRVSPGATYGVRVWRDGGHEIDTFPNALLFAGLTIVPTSYGVYEVR